MFTHSSFVITEQKGAIIISWLQVFVTTLSFTLRCAKQVRSAVASKHKNLACWTQKDVLYLDQQSFCALKSAARVSLERLMTIDPQQKPPGQQTTVFLESPWAVKSSLHTSRVFGFPLCPAWSEPKDSCRCLLCLVCSVKCVNVADVCLVMHFNSALYYEFYKVRIFKKCLQHIF